MSNDKKPLDLDFVLMLAHELRAPLGIVKESIALVSDRILGKTNEKQQKVLTTARKNVNRIDRIIMNVVDIFKLDEKRLELRKEPVDMVVIARRAMDAVRVASESKGLLLKGVFSSDEIKCFADKQRMFDIFSHLLGNAVKFTEKGSVQIEVRRMQKNIECVVRDTGIGIAKEHVPLIFDKFAQFGWVPGGGEKGMGLGLAITKGLIELHGGSVKVESDPGKGSEFRFTIPAESI